MDFPSQEWILKHHNFYIIHTTIVYWKFSPREPKCLDEVAVRDWDGSFRTKHQYRKSSTNYSENNTNWGYITSMQIFMLIAECHMICVHDLCFHNFYYFTTIQHASACQFYMKLFMQLYCTW